MNRFRGQASTGKVALVMGAVVFVLGLVGVLLLRASFYLNIPGQKLGVVMSYFGDEKK